MKNTSILIIFFIASLFGFSCRKNNPGPNESFYCKIDGKAFRPDNDGDIFFEPLLAQWDLKNKMFYFIVYGNDSHSISISSKFQKNEDFGLKKYNVNREFIANYNGDLILINGSNVHEKFQSFEDSGFIEFSKIDTTKRRVSGTFEFKLKNERKTVSITKGQFNDVFYY
jgi:hypothetical protein